MNPQTDAAESHTARQSSRAIGWWPGAWLRGELGLWRSIARRRPVAWTLLGVGFLVLLTPALWLAHARYQAHLDRLHRAVYVGDVDEIRRLLAAGADVNQPSRSGVSYYDSAWMVFPPFNLQSRMVFEDPPIVSSWQIWGITIYESPGWDRGATPLLIAAWHAPDDPGLIAALVSAGADVNAAPGETSPLYAVVIRDHVNAARELIAAGANVNVFDRSGYFTPLHYAALFQNVDLVRILLEAGADPNLNGEPGWSVLHSAMKSKSPAPEIVRLLVSAGIDVNVRDEDGETLLHLAVHWGDLALGQLLLDVGADPDVEDEAGRTPRSMGQSHHDPAIRALFERELQDEVAP